MTDLEALVHAAQAHPEDEATLVALAEALADAPGSERLEQVRRWVRGYPALLARQIAVEVAIRLHLPPAGLIGPISVPDGWNTVTATAEILPGPNYAPSVTTSNPEGFVEVDTEIIDGGPRYVHDCDSCIFLGRHEQYDLYFADHGGGLADYEPFASTVIARYSSDGPGYISGLGFVGKIDAITEAERRAVARGLLRRVEA
jgi:hypothetical protein